MSLPKISPIEARRLLDRGAILVDIREADEHAREKIAGARHLPLSRLDEADLALHDGSPVIFIAGAAHARWSMPPGSPRKQVRPAKPSSSKAASTPGERRGSPS